MRRLAPLLALAACTKGSPPAPTPVAEAPRPKSAPRADPVPEALFAQSCDDVTAVWTGPLDAPEPKRLAAEHLTFRFTDGGTATWAPDGQLFGPDLDVEVFSPDCAWVVLPKDHYGPYQVVRRGALAAALTHPASFRSLGAPVDGGEPAQVHAGARWRSPSELEFQAGCCGSVAVYRVDVASPTPPRSVFFAPSAPHGLRETDGGWEVAP